MLERGADCSERERISRERPANTTRIAILQLNAFVDFCRNIGRASVRRSRHAVAIGLPITKISGRSWCARV